MTLVSCGLSTQTLTNNKSNVQVISTKEKYQDHTDKGKETIKDIDINKYHLKPLATPSFNSNDEIVKSFESVLRAEKDCRLKLYKLKKEVLEKQERMLNDERNR